MCCGDTKPRLIGGPLTLLAALAKLLKALDTFNKCEALERVREMRGHPSVLIEKKFNLRNLACRVLGVVDFAARNEGDPGIVDWKIGTGDGRGLGFQCVGMWSLCSSDMTAMRGFASNSIRTGRGSIC